MTAGNLGREPAFAQGGACGTPHRPAFPVAGVAALRDIGILIAPAAGWDVQVDFGRPAERRHEAGLHLEPRGIVADQSQGSS